MAFNSYNLEKLRQLSLQLQGGNSQQETSKPSSTKKTPKLHKVETEQDPHKLFHSLMDISPDGNVPSHLVSRLKQTESKKQTGSDSNFRYTDNSEFKENINSIPKSKTEKEDDLYRSFKNLLLEDEI